jgi:hypothetical protein
MTQRSSRISACLALVALATILGHVCVLPGHSHAAVAGHHDHDQPAHDYPDRPDGAHVASCDALRSPSTAHAAPLPVPTISIGGLEGPGSPAITLRHDGPAPASSPPLYLAHRTLLI